MHGIYDRQALSLNPGLKSHTADFSKFVFPNLALYFKQQTKTQENSKKGEKSQLLFTIKPLEILKYNCFESKLLNSLIL